MLLHGYAQIHCGHDEAQESIGMRTRLDRLNARRIDPEVRAAKLLNESWRMIHQSESVKYVIGAMQQIDPEYTRNTYAQGERVRNQLEQNLTQTCEYKYQGSTTNDTHIKAASDIDLLVLTERFVALERPQVPTRPYEGNPQQDLTDLRSESVLVLRAAFPRATVDTSGRKSISISGGSLTRKVDVVPANWWNTNKYAECANETFRGVEVFDIESGTRVANTPFLHNAMIEYRDRETHGGLRKAARLLKSLKYDSESIDLSSYDLVSIAYNMPTDHLTVFNKDEDLRIADSCQQFVRALLQHDALRNSIMVPDGHRAVFASGYATKRGLEQLALELDRLIADVLYENQRSFKKLAEARVAY